MIKLIAASRKRPGLTRADYQRYIEMCHGTIARENPYAIRRYVQNHVIDGAFGVLSDDTHQQTADRDGVVELFFDNFHDFITTLEPAEPSAASKDGKFFADEPNSITIVGEEYEIPVANPLATFNPGLGLAKAVGELKICQFIMRDDDVFAEDFHVLWRQAHDAALEAVPYAKKQLRRCAANRRSRLNDNDAAARKHFKMVNPPKYDLMVAHWYDTMEQAGAFREYNEALMAFAPKFANWSKSFFVYTKAITIIQNKAA